MGIINYKADPLALCGSEITEYNQSITNYLLDRQLHPDYLTIHLNCEQILTFKECGFVDNRLIEPLKENDVVSIVYTPKGFDPITIAIIGVVASLGVTLLLQPAINPNNSGVTQESPNNTLQAQNNIARPYQAIPDVYGEPVCIPDLSGEATQEYIQQAKGPAKKVISQLMPICIQTYQVDSVTTSKTPLDDIGGTYTVHQPVNGVTTVPSVKETFSINEVDGQELYAPNQAEGTVIFNGSVSESVSKITYDAQADLSTLETDGDLSAFLNLNYPTGGKINFTYNNAGSNDNVDVGVISIENVSLSGGIYSVVYSSENKSSYTDVNFIYLTSYNSQVIGPFTSETDGTQLWIDFIFQRGLKGSCVVRVNYEINNGTATHTDYQTYTFTKDSLDQQFFTEKLTSPIGSGSWTVSFVRTNDVSDDAGSPSQCKIERVATIREYTNKQYGNVTLLGVEVPATLNATSLRENKIQVKGGRMVIGYNRSTNQIDYTLRRSRTGADHILHEFVSVFNRDPSSLDIETLYDIYENLPDPRLGYFDWTFDDLNTSLGQRINTIANAARIYVIPKGDTYTFRRDELQAFPSTILSRADISKNNRQYKYTYQPQMNSDKDSVRVEYVDPSINKKAFISLKWDGSNFVEGDGANPLKIELPCVQEQYNAMNRAQLEIRKLFYLTETITDTFLNGNANLIEEGELIRYEEVYNEDVIGGEVRSFSGNVINLSESVPDGANLLFSYVQSNGKSIAPISFTKTGSKQITLQNAPAGIFSPTATNSRGSAYVISTLQTYSELEYIAGAPKYSNDGKTVQIVLSKHDARVYEYDEV